MQKNKAASIYRNELFGNNCYIPYLVQDIWRKKVRWTWFDGYQNFSINDNIKKQTCWNDNISWQEYSTNTRSTFITEIRTENNIIVDTICKLHRNIEHIPWMTNTTGYKTQWRVYVTNIQTPTFYNWFHNTRPQNFDHNNDMEALFDIQLGHHCKDGMYQF